jgi:general secretion pathway protein L
MSDTLLIHYSITEPHNATWALSNDAGEIIDKITTGTLEELSEAAASHPMVMLLDSQCLHINQLKLPTHNMQKMLKAIPFALEEYIAEDIENFHFVISRNKHNDTTSVVGVDKDTLRQIIDIFQQVGITLEKIIPDTLCMAADAESRQWVCLNFNENTYLQTDVLNGMASTPELIPYILSSKLKEAEDKPKKLLLFCEQENTSVFDVLNFEEMGVAAMEDETEENGDKEDGGTEIINVVYNTHPLVVFCGHYKQAMPLNLLQNEFKVNRKSSGNWQHWRLAASLIAIWLVLHLGLTGFQLSQLTDENKVTKAKIEQIYKKSFPKSKKIVNPRAQMEQKLNALRSNAGGAGNGLVYLLAQSFGAVSHDKKNITLQTLTFRNNRMDIGLDSKNLQTIETLNQNLNKSGRIKSEITSSSSEKNKVKGNLRIEGRS